MRCIISSSCPSLYLINPVQTKKDQSGIDIVHIRSSKIHEFVVKQTTENQKTQELPKTKRFKNYRKPKETRTTENQKKHKLPKTDRNKNYRKPKETQTTENR